MHPFHVLDDVYAGLCEMGEPAHGCHAREVELDMADGPAPASRPAFLKAAPSPEAAHGQINRIYNAMHPGRRLSAERSCTRQRLKREQPERPVKVGTHWRRCS